MLHSGILISAQKWKRFSYSECKTFQIYPKRQCKRLNLITKVMDLGLLLSRAGIYQQGHPRSMFCRIEFCHSSSAVD